jgi:hypothetical protein
LSSDWEANRNGSGSQRNANRRKCCLRL